MELWDIYNMHREKTGETMVRGHEFKDGCYHLVVHVCIFNAEGKMEVI